MYCGCIVIGVSVRFRQCAVTTKVTTSCWDVVILFFIFFPLFALSCGQFRTKSFLFTFHLFLLRLHSGAGTPVLPLIYLLSSPVRV
jgi:hypothetical protein